MLSQSFQNIPFHESHSSEFLSGLEREVGTKMLEFGADMFSILFTTSQSCYLLVVVFCVRGGTQVCYNLSFCTQKLKASPDLTQYDSLVLLVVRQLSLKCDPPEEVRPGNRLPVNASCLTEEG